MKGNKRLLLACLTMMLFVVAWAVTTPSSAKRSKDKGEVKSAKDDDSYKESLIKRFEGRDSATASVETQDSSAQESSSESAAAQEEEEGNDPDIPGFLKSKLNPREHFMARSKQVAEFRGYEPDRPFDISARRKALNEMEQQQARLSEELKKKIGTEAVPSVWTAVGPTPIPNGQTQTSSVPVSGRVTCIDVHPTNALIAYVGTAQGGLYRTADGGTTWTNIMAGTPASGNPPAPPAGFSPAGTLAIGAVTIDPVTPSTVFVGTGEGNLSLDSFFGEGVYRIINADTTPTVQGPFETRTNGGGGHAFAGTSINKIIIDPNNDNNMFVGNTLGGSGLNGENFCCGNITPVSGFVGLYFSVNAQAATPDWVRVNPASLPGGGVAGVSDIAIDPTNANILILQQLDFGGGTLPNSGIFRSTNALLGATATYAKVVNFAGTQTNGKFAAYKQGAAATVFYAATGESNGRLRVSVDAGATWSAVIAAANGYCDGQCFYDIGVAADPGATTATTDDVIYLAGNVRGASTKLLARSDDGGATFSNIDNTLHADSHAVRIAPSNLNTVYTGNDGGIWRSDNAKAAAATVTWFDANTSTFSATQYVSMDIHPTDPNFTLGGTQDNGTHLRDTTGAWTRADFGDGGYAVIDQNAVDPVNVTMYHTYFNQSNNLLGYARVDSMLNASDGMWNFMGCNGNVPGNGITCADATNFYAPLVRGPNAADSMTPTPHNTIYYGTDRLYRSADKGVTNTVVSQAPLVAGVPVSAIGIAPSNDNVRAVGLNNGALFYTTTGSSTLTNLDPTNIIPNKYIGRIIFDPSNADTLYISLDGYTGAANHVWRVRNLSTTPNITPASGGQTMGPGTVLPDVPVNALAIDPIRTARIFAGTDIGVYISDNGGQDWAPFGTGLPRVAVLGLNLQPTSRTLRAATHGLGMYEITVPLPTAAATDLTGTVTTPDGNPLAGVIMTLNGSHGTARAITNSYGNYSFEGLETGDFYTVAPARANFSFSPVSRSYSMGNSVTDAVFTATPASVAVGNPLETDLYFVRQQYVDFLSREPERDGLAYWANEISKCGVDADCIHQRKIDVSAAFFMSREFQDTGSFVYLMYRGTLGRVPAYAEFMPDRSKVVGGVTLEQSKAQFVNQWVERDEFRQAYPDTLSGAQYVQKLLDTAGLGGDTALRASLLQDLNGGKTRAEVLRTLVDNQELRNREYNSSFVLMEYFGYLRRDPEADGFKFWLNVLSNKEPGNYRGMVCSFITSAEYQERFSSVVLHSNRDCAR
jgi:hypothetical protein